MCNVSLINISIITVRTDNRHNVQCQFDQYSSVRTDNRHNVQCQFDQYKY